MLQRFQTMYAKPAAAPVSPDAFQVQVTTTSPSQDFKVNFDSPTDLLVDWGDGNSDTYNTTGLKTHTYASAGTHTVSMSGHVHSINFYSLATPTLLSAILTPIGGVDGIESVFGMFRGCTGLVSLPADLFRFNTALTDVSNCFVGCTGLVSLPADLFRFNINLESVEYTFYFCSHLNAIPASLFDHNQGVTSFAYSFFLCAAIEGNAPALWTRSPEPTGTACFYGCTGLDNYASIPAGWK